VPRGDAIGDDGAEPEPGAPSDRDAPEVDDLHHRLEVGVPRHRRRHGVAGQLRLRHRRLGATGTLPTTSSSSICGSGWTASVRDEEEIDSSVRVLEVGAEMRGRSTGNGERRFGGVAVSSGGRKRHTLMADAWIELAVGSEVRWAHRTAGIVR